MEKIIYLLESHGFVLIDSPEKADIIIVNTCGVKLPTENKIIDRIKVLKSINPKIVVTGCLPRINRRRMELLHVSLVDVYSLPRIVEAVQRTMNGERVLFFSEQSPEILDIPQKSTSEFTGIVQISYGCLGSCSYCGTKFAREHLISLPLDAVVSRVISFLKEGKKEIYLTSQDCGCYGFDIGTRLPELMRRIASIKKRFFVRVGMMNPNYLLTFVDEFVELIQEPVFYKFAHVPVQSGSDDILKAMNRKYSADEFIELVKRLRKVPDITISTDIIVGFPGETEEDFQQTLELLRKTKPNIVNISKFFPRPGTPAAGMKQVDSSVVKERSRIITHLVGKISFENMKKHIGKSMDALSVERDVYGNTVCHTYNFRKAVIEDNLGLGEFYTVRIKDASRTTLFAVLE
jgi:MiaB-like tRNA modifying enzyme